MRKMILLALAICIISKSNAYNIVSDATCYEIVDNSKKTVRLIECWYEGEHFTIPEQVIWQDTAYQVVSISNLAFKRCTYLKTIEIPTTVKSIAVSAFNYCSKLEQILVSESNPIYCDADGVLYSADRQTLLHFPRAKKATSFHIPDNVSNIGAYAFFKCDGLEKVDLPPALTQVGIGAFNGCHHLKSVVFPHHLESIGDFAFYDCPNLLEVTLSSMHFISFQANTFCYQTLKEGRLTLPSDISPNVLNQYKQLGFANVAAE